MNIIFFCLIFLIGEVIINKSFFPYLISYFNTGEISGDEASKKFLGINISIFKGLLERFVLYFSLVIGLTQVLIVYGAIKIGTRFEKNDKIKNDYFLIGNFSSILFAIIYYFIFDQIKDLHSSCFSTFIK
ncbi:hypothetical protein J2Y38_000084 [Flavobacterium sp. 2755]|uniref:hypothetical protein n=1 Tax=Flavobacterium sp. 2755 TaxID=2817765 RepID=UPI0028586765|nr:hypothetical protein [Flavobacterium sp. 2755]MDR6759905.1 hypothetical protein [Flavobacterium sp. 2755]